MIQQIIAVVLVLGLLMAALWLLRRRGLATLNYAGIQMAGQGRQDRRLRVLERVVLTPQHSLHLVSIGNRLVVFSASPTSCQAVDQNIYNFDSSGDNRREASF